MISKIWKFSSRFWIVFLLFISVFLKSNNAVAVLGVGDDVHDLLVESNTTKLVVSAEAQNVQGIDSYARQALQLQQAIIDTEMLIRDLEENPLEVIVPDVNQLLANQARINKLAQDIDSNSGRVGANLMRNLEHPKSIGLGMGSKFQWWSDAREKAVNESFDMVQQFVLDAKDQNKTLSQAIKNIAASRGKTATAKATANAAGQQLSLMHQMTRTLNQMLADRTVESAAAIATERNAEEAVAEVANNGPAGKATKLKIEKDIYQGPGQRNVDRAF